MYLLISSALIALSTLALVGDMRCRAMDRHAVAVERERTKRCEIEARDRAEEREALLVHARAEEARSKADLAMAEAKCVVELAEAPAFDPIDLVAFDTNTGEERPRWMRKIEW